MQDLARTVGLGPILDRAGVPWVDRNFEDVYDSLYRRNPTSSAVRELEGTVRDYFSVLQLPPCVTAYDYLVLTLRAKDVIASFNWDPLLLQAYARHAAARELPHVVFLHGNVAVGYCEGCKVKGWVTGRCGKCGSPFTPSRLLYPVSSKDYASDPFISAEWQNLQQYLQRAYFLTIFGYSAPRTDAAAIELLMGAWRNNQTQTLAEVEVIDVRPEDELVASWRSFITREHYMVTDDIRRSYLAWHPRRSCEALAFATLQNDPWPDNWMPEFGNPGAMLDWVKPLIDQEEALDSHSTPFSRASLSRGAKPS